MKFRISLWAGVGFLVAGLWAVYAMLSTPPALVHGDPIMPLVRLTCPIAIFSFYPISVYWVLIANAATYALVGLMVEGLQRGLHSARS